MASARARALCGSAPPAKVRPQGWGGPGDSTHPAPAGLIPPPKSCQEQAELSSPSARGWDLDPQPLAWLRLKLWGTRGFGYQNPKTGGGERNPQGEASQKCRMPGMRGEPRPGGGDAPTLRCSGISATPNSPPGPGVSPRQGPNSHLHHPRGVCPRAPQDLESLPPPFSQPVAYKDLCLTCLSERSIKGTDSQLGRCLPSIPTIHFPTIINCAGSYHQPKVNLMK